MAPFSPLERIETWNGIRFFVRKSTSDVYVLREVFTDSVYEKSPQGIVIDVGANIGAYSLYAAQTADRVYAFEPEHSNFEQLQKNIALNACTNVIAEKKAIMGHRGTVSLHRASANKGRSSITLAVSRDTELVEATTLDAIIDENNLDRVSLLKVDIEGGEYDLFEHVSCKALSSIDRIVMELHYVKGKKAADLIQKLEDAGFLVRRKKPFLPFVVLGISMLFAERVGRVDGLSM